MSAPAATDLSKWGYRWCEALEDRGKNLKCGERQNRVPGTRPMGLGSFKVQRPALRSKNPVNFRITLHVT